MFSISPIQSIIPCSIANEQMNVQPVENAVKIHDVLQEANNTFFFPNSMQLDLLKNQSQVIPILAQWLYEEWHSYDITLTKEKLVDSLNKRQNDDKIPITFVVLKNAAPIGMIALKEQSDPEFSDFPKESLWMGSFHVAPEERSKGLGQELLKVAETVAIHLGYKEIFFYTSNPKNVPWYLKRGASLIEEERSFRNHKIAIMKILLAKK
jgi:GNAT superfamily N-acetyltransferase